MARTGRSPSLSVLIVRPGAGQSLSPTYRFEIPRHSARSLPAGLLYLASAVKLATHHRVVVHDVRKDDEGNRGLRSIAKLVRPDLALVWLHPASIEGGLETARALRQSGAGVLVGTGPLVDLWPEGARRIPELDGLLPRLSPDGLCAALDVLAAGGSAPALMAALATTDRQQPLRDPLERKLLDYAVYDRCADAHWPPQQRLGFGPLSRLAARSMVRGKAPAVSPVLLSDIAGDRAALEAVVGDLRSCALLGIDWLDLRVVSGHPQPETPYLAALCSMLTRHRASCVRRQRLRLTLSASQLHDLGLQRLQAAGICAVHFGAINAGDGDDLSAAIAAARSCRAAAIHPSGTLLLGCSGYDLEEDRRGVSVAIRAGFPLSAGVDVRVGSVDAGRWFDWLDAPARDFLPPGLETERFILADRARVALLPALSRPGAS